ncbi:hypothetical protein ACFU3O_23850 [Streptomyces antibioticus]|uniref:hypothetical protein n=1 Tax=Streptomyces antibioticus TaxID=1890 RepID=UPI00368F3C50
MTDGSGHLPGSPAVRAALGLGRAHAAPLSAEFTAPYPALQAVLRENEGDFAGCAGAHTSYGGTCLYPG